jgi:hypothetical protein
MHKWNMSTMPDMYSPRALVLQCHFITVLATSIYSRTTEMRTNTRVNHLVSPGPGDDKESRLCYDYSGRKVEERSDWQSSCGSRTVPLYQSGCQEGGVGGREIPIFCVENFVVMNGMQSGLQNWSWIWLKRSLKKTSQLWKLCPTRSFRLLTSVMLLIFIYKELKDQFSSAPYQPWRSIRTVLVPSSVKWNFRLVSQEM